MINDAHIASRAADLVEMLPGYPFRSSIPDDPEGPVGVVQMKDVSEDGINWSGLVRTDLPGRREPDWLRPRDVLLLNRGSRTLAVCLDEVPIQAVISPHFYLLRIKPGALLLPEFLAWQINQAPAQRHFQSCAVGTLQMSLRRSSVEEFLLLLLVVPDLITQKRVVELASLVRQEVALYEKLIENRRQVLKAIAEDILKDDGVTR